MFESSFHHVVFRECETLFQCQIDVILHETDYVISYISDFIDASLDDYYDHYKCFEGKCADTSYYRSPTNLRESNVFIVSVCNTVHKGSPRHTGPSALLFIQGFNHAPPPPCTGSQPQPSHLYTTLAQLPCTTAWLDRHRTGNTTFLLNLFCSNTILASLAE